MARQTESGWERLVHPKVGLVSASPASMGLQHARFAIDRRATAAEAVADRLQTVNDDEVLKPLHQLVGLPEIKRTAEEIRAQVMVHRLRQQAGLRVQTDAYHMIFAGNPGTGKTTVARLMGRFFADLGLLTKGHLVEVERADLVGEYVGHTAQKTRALLDRASGGVLFVDEAYALARGGEKDFGREAIDVLVKGLEDRRHDLIVILAGYAAEMEWFLSQNPGLPSRFPLHFTFPDLTEKELVSIAHGFAQEREYVLSPEATLALRHALRREKERSSSFGNGRAVRNLLERAMRQQALRMARHTAPTRDDLMELRASDFRDSATFTRSVR